MKLAAFLAGIGVGIALTVWAIGRSMSTAERTVTQRDPEADTEYDGERWVEQWRADALQHPQAWPTVRYRQPSDGSDRWVVDESEEGAGVRQGEDGRGA